MARSKTIKSEVSEEAVMGVETDALGETKRQPGRLLMNVKSGAQAAVSQIGPSVSGGLRVAAYRGIYSVAYGVTFGLLLAEKLIPVKGFVAEAIEEGHTAAKEAFAAREALRADETPDSVAVSA